LEFDGGWPTDHPPRVPSRPERSAAETDPRAEPLFFSLVDQIEAAYQRFGQQLGWRFLYTPARTLSPKTRLAFIGQNPGGSTYEPPSASVEEGNAYRLETWPGATQGGLNPLQAQIGLLHEALASELADSTPTRLMDDTLAANFCPFRSPRWDKLAHPEESIAFSKDLWRTILEFVRPGVIVCLGDLAARQIGVTLATTGARLVRAPEVRPVGWGSVTYEIARYESSDVRTLLVRMPHLSRYRILGRADSQAAVDNITAAIAAAMRDNTEPPSS
jgi:uracil-DNA glycosylase